MLNFVQPPGAGGTFAGDGKHGSIIPSPRRVRSRNDMRVISVDGNRNPAQHRCRLSADGSLVTAATGISRNHLL
jgi:hypothetical protein